MKKTIIPFVKIAKDVQTDSKHLAACQMCIFGALQIVFECSKDALDILNKYGTKNHSLKTSISSIKNFAHNSSKGLANLADKQGDVERAGVTALSAANFIALYFSAIKVRPEDLDAFCAEVEALSEKYFIQK